MIKIKLNEIEIFTFDFRDNENHQEHNVAIPKAINIELNTELSKVIKKLLKSAPTIHQAENTAKKGIKINPHNLENEISFIVITLEIS